MKIDRAMKMLLIFTSVMLIANFAMLVNKKEASAAENTLANDAQFQVFSGGFFFYVPSEGRIYKYNTTGRRLQTYAITKLGEDFKIAY